MNMQNNCPFVEAKLEIYKTCGDIITLSLPKDPFEGEWDDFEEEE